MRAQPSLTLTSLPAAARLYVAGIMALGAVVMLASFPTTLPRPLLFVCLTIFSCLTSLWKVPLPLPLSNGATLSTSYAAALMALVLLGPSQAMVVGVAGVWAQCTFRVKQPYPWYRTAFSMAAEAITVQATAVVYGLFGDPAQLLSAAELPKALAAVVPAYFLVNTGLVAIAIALAMRQPVAKVWHDNFLWSAPSYMVVGTAGAAAAVVIQHGNPWLAVFVLPPIYLTYRTYHVFLGRIDDQRRHVEETERLHREALDHLMQARRAEAALAEQKERLAVTLRSIGDGVITTDLAGNVVLLNNVAELLTGWNQQDAAGKPIDAVFQNFDPRTRERCDNAVGLLTRREADRSLCRCTLLVSKQLTERPIEEISAPIRDASGQTIGVVVAFRDISDALRAQAERAQASRVASLGLLAGGIGHDFNNILMAIMGNVSVARVMTPAGAAARALDEAQQACVRARQLTWQLLTFSRGGVPVKKPVVLPSLVEEAASLALRGSNVRCTFDVAADLWGVSADEGQLVQVFNNILINARQAMPGGGTVEIRVENVYEDGQRSECGLTVQAGPYVRISIRDTGTGIPGEHVARIFDPYFTTKQQGSGLGLATSYSIVKNHGGYVSVASTLGEGTTMRVSLPAANVSEITPVVSTRRPAGMARVLVMDDEPGIRTLAVNMLKFLGHDAEVVEDGTAAVERYHQALESGRPFDAVLLDLVIPGGMGGRETIERLNEIDPSVNAVVVSGYAQDPAVTEFRSYGFKASIAKPYTLAELDYTLQSVIRTPKCRVH
jgi:PAS domain S-box-containing protein